MEAKKGNSGKPGITKFTSVLFTLFLLLSLFLQTGPAYAAETGKICILHTNDIHCEVDVKTDPDTGKLTALGYPAVAALKKAMAAEYGAGNVTLVDDGDQIQGGNLGVLSSGSWIIDLMNRSGYDLAIPGNHEFDYGFNRFMELTKKADFPFLCCNLTRLSDGSSLLPSYKILTYGNVKVAYVGIDTPESFTKSTPTFFQDNAGNYLYSFAEDSTGEKLYAAVQKSVDEARAKGADYVVALGHLGETDITDRWRASTVIAHTKGIDILIDGHSHEQIEREIPNIEGKNVVDVQTGFKLAAIGKIVIDPATGEITHELVTDYTAQDPDVAALVKEIKEKCDGKLNQVIGSTKTKLCVTDPATGKRMVRNTETNLGDFCADANRLVLGTDIGIINGGGIRADLGAGQLTYGNALSVYPFGNQCCIVKVKGQQILDALEFSAWKYPGENGGFLQVSGLSFTLDPSVKTPIILTEKQEFSGVSGERRIKDVKVNGTPIQADADYTVGGINYTLINGGDGYTMFKNATVVKDAVMDDITLLVTYIENRLKGSIPDSYGNPYGQGRISILSAGTTAAAGELTAGSTGSTGSTVSTGSTGSTGSTVSTGSVGSTGSAGSTGSTGSTGSGQASPESYLVKSGDTLWKIAKACYGNGSAWTRIYTANPALLPDPDRIRPGLKLIIPQ